MTLAQIGEFSFVIAGVGLATNAAPAALYQVAVAVSVLTALLTPLLMRLADPLSAVIDRRLPKPVQTVVTLYESWVELMRRRTKTEGSWDKIRRPIRWLLIDAVVLAAIALVISLLRVPMSEWLIRIGVPSRFGLVGLFVGGTPPVRAVRLRPGHVRAAGGLPVRGGSHAQGSAGSRCGPCAARRAGGSDSLRHRAGPGAAPARDHPAVPQCLAGGGGDRRVHLPAHLLVLESARDLQGHALAGAELIVDVIARQGVDKDEHAIETGAGDAAWHGHDRAVQGGDGQQCDRPLPRRPQPAWSYRRERRGDQPERAEIGVPKADEVLQAGDVLALTGSHDAVFAAHKLLGKSPTQAAAGYVS
jgi:CPA2 family monovalent cation:H+ antiporter-2